MAITEWSISLKMVKYVTCAAAVRNPQGLGDFLAVAA
jgi:hypothetical protein